MDKKGHESTMEALRAADIKAEILPVPKDGEDLPNVTIFYEGVPPFALSSLLNVLDSARLTTRWDGGGDRGPRLQFLSQTNDSATFSDDAVKQPPRASREQNED